MGCPVVKYNDYTFPNVYGPYTFSQTATDFRFGCNFLILAANSSGLIDAEEVLLEKTKEVKKDFFCSFNTADEFDLQHEITGGTGFNARATVTKIASPEYSTETSRAYHLAVEMQLPYVQDNGRIAAKMDVSYTPTRQAVANFTIEYSASVSNNVYAVYKADSWVSTMLSSFFVGGEVMEIVGESISQDQNQKRATITVRYQQVLFPASADSNVDSKIVNASFNYALRHTTQVNAFLTSEFENLPLLELSLSYVGQFDRTKVSSPNDMSTLWQSNIRGRLLKEATNLLKPSSYGYSSPTLFVKNERVAVNPSQYTVSASMEIGCKISDSQVVFAQEKISITNDSGLIYLKLWDGKPNTYALGTRGATTVLQRSAVVAQIGSPRMIPAMPKTYGGIVGEWTRIRSVLGEEKKWDGVNVTISGSDSASAKKIPIFFTSVSETYLLVDSANSINTVIGQIGGQTTTGT